MLPATLASFLGNRPAVDILRRAVEQERMPHAMIFAGPAGVGKCTLALMLARHLNCPSPTSEGACGRCPTCRRINAVQESRYLACLTPRGELPCGGCMNCRTLADQHPDVRVIQPPPDKTTIGIDQVRELIAEISYQPFEARFRVIILDPAEQMKTEAHNSLLKTLEEPPSRTIIILVTTKPYLLLQTIHSRSRRLQFGEIPEREIEEYLVRAGRRSPEEAGLAAVFSHGSLALALSFDTGHFRLARAEALRFVALLLKRGRFTDASALAAVQAKDKGAFGLWLEAVEAALQDVYLAQVAPDRVRQRDLQTELAALARAASHEAVVAAVRGVQKLRLALQSNVNRQIALESLFLAVRACQ
jgi:DNA polymerase III subunit delta'